MSLPIIALIVIAGLVAAYVIGVYNSLQTLKTQIQASIQEIGNQLKRQASLIPNLENAVEGYMDQEKQIFTMLTDARRSVEQADKTGSPADIEEAVNQMQQLVPRIQVAVEDNPEIQSDKTVTNFMNELRDTADKLMYARRSVIDLTQNYNVKLVTFPSNIVANIFGFTPEKGLETDRAGSHLAVSKEEMQDVEVSLGSDDKK
jgi:LemA protein